MCPPIPGLVDLIINHFPWLTMLLVSHPCLIQEVTAKSVLYFLCVFEYEG